MQYNYEYNYSYNYKHIEREIESMAIFSPQNHVEICRMNPSLNSIITADSLFSSEFTSPCTSSYFGDSLGMESCVDVLPEEDFHLLITPGRRAPPQPSLGRDRRSSGDLPPPMPSLARTENLLPRLPWTLRRRYTPDGRLVLTEEPRPRHEYFLADRSNGRLTLHLVDASSNAEERDDEEVEEEEAVSPDDDRGDDHCESDAAEAVAMEMKRLEVSRRRCVDVGMGVPAAMRPVHG